MNKNNLVKIFSILISFISIFALLGCNEDILSIKCILSSETYMQDEIVNFDSTSSLSCVGIKGEREACQVILNASENVHNFNIAVSDLKCGENVIYNSNINIYAEKYVEIKDAYINSGNTNVTFPAYVGFYPDALLPFALYKNNNENNLSAGLNQGIWIEINIPANAVAGNYEGEVTVTYNKNHKKNIPVSLKVYDLLMPEQVHSRTAINIWHTQLEYGEKSNYDENTNQRYYDFLLEKRLCSSYVPLNKRKTLDDFVDYMVELALNPKVTSYKIWNDYLGITDTTHLSINAPSLEGLTDVQKREKHLLACSQTYNGIINVFTKMLNKNVEKLAECENLDLFQKALFYFEDEPAKGFRTERTKKFNEILTKAKKDFISNNIEIFNAYPNLKNSLLNCFKDITPTDILDESLFVSTKDNGNGVQVPDYDKGDGVTLWCLHCYKVQSTATRTIIKERQSYGEEFWWYNCTRTSPAPSYYLEAKTMNIRLQSWQQFQYGFKGVLYWDAVHWQELPNCDPFESLQYGIYGNGEGILMYPGYKYGTKTPISSIRLEQISQGQEDYEYLYMLNEYLCDYNIANGTNYDMQEIVANLIKNLHSGSYLKEEATAQELEEIRLVVLDVLQNFANGASDSAIQKIASIISQ